MESPEAIVLTRARDGAIVAVNREWLKLTGFAENQVLGRTVMEIGHWPDAQTWVTALRPLETDKRVSDLDITLVMANGVQRLICLNAVVVHVQGEDHIS